MSFDQPPEAHCACCHDWEQEVFKLTEALEMLYQETKDYIVINKLGDPHHNQSMKLARAALKLEAVK